MLKIVFRLFAAMVVCGQLGACASVMSGTSQAVFVETPMADGASCQLTDSKKGAWHLPSTPATVTVQKGDGPMNVVCEKAGYNSGILSVDEELDGATMGNILIGGVVGFVADAASGAAQKYPDKIAVWMRPKEWVSSDAEAAWNRVKFEYEEAARLEKERKSGRASNQATQQPAVQQPQIVYQPMYMSADGTLSPAPQPQPGQSSVIYMTPPQSIADPTTASMAGKSLPSAQAAYEKTGQQMFQDKIASSVPPAGQATDRPWAQPTPPVSSRTGTAERSGSAGSPESYAAGDDSKGVRPVYMMPVVVQPPSPPPAPAWDCTPGNKIYLAGTGCR